MKHFNTNKFKLMCLCILAVGFLIACSSGNDYKAVDAGEDSNASTAMITKQLMQAKIAMQQFPTILMKEQTHLLLLNWEVKDLQIWRIRLVL